MEGRARRCRETMSPERFKVCVKPRGVNPTSRKVQVVYYLSRNGHLEHPHYMEVTHLAHQHLRLKDVMDRLTLLRGKGMPSLYSWSSKRSYKNGYVWNDLAENDIIYPSDEAEYVLKGSELIDGCTEKLQQLQVRSRSQQVPGSTFRQTRNPVPTKRQQSEPEADNNGYEDEDDDEEEEEEEDKGSYTSSMTPQYSRCSRGVSTDDTELQREEAAKKINPTTELTLDNNSSPPSATSSTVSDKANDSNNASKRFEDSDPVAAELSPVSRNSVLLHLISCGGSASFRGKSVSVVREQPPATVTIRRSSGASLHKGVLCKTAAAGKKLVAAAAEEEVEEEEKMISCMSENPRFGNLQAEEKEYFSGSIVESIAGKRVQVESGLKRSSSYNEERSSKAELGEAVEEEPKRDQKAGMKGKCIPRMKYSNNSKQPRK